MKGPEKPGYMADPVDPVKDQLIEEKQDHPGPPDHGNVPEGKAVEETENGNKSALAQDQENGGKESQGQIIDDILPLIQMAVLPETDKQFDPDDEEKYTVCDEMLGLHLLWISEVSGKLPDDHTNRRSNIQTVKLPDDHTNRRSNIQTVQLPDE
jgi:hypothetical protein